MVARNSPGTNHLRLATVREDLGRGGLLDYNDTNFKPILILSSRSG